MSDPERIDFGALDPTRDRARWEAQVESVVARALARRRSVPRQLVAWRRPTLAAAALLAAAVWIALVWRAPDRSDPVAQLSEWAQNDEVPAPARILELFGDQDAAR